MTYNQYKGSKGWMPDIDHIGTTMYGYTDVPPETMKPIAVINHIMQGYARTMIDWATNNSVQKSAHFIIDREGNITQTVSIYSPAWHAGRTAKESWKSFPGGNPNKYTVGIEHEGFSVDPGYGYDYIYDGSWPEAMMDASAKVHKWILGELSLDANDQTVIGHFETDAVSRANDPGPQWSREDLLSRINGGGGSSSSQPSVSSDELASIKERLDILEEWVQSHRAF
ncbi:MAG: N-acetylmuramoyl-L-alanine amidase [Dehalococcoidia bacterium]|nr:N-acetylmuramoyl-L-alanine amidase [Dehalococcoidia bacterium]